MGEPQSFEKEALQAFPDWEVENFVRSTVQNLLHKMNA